jgi:hypothetical protein
LFPFCHLIVQEARHVEIARVQEPLPENEFVVQARESIPGPRARTTTATTHGRGRGRSTRGRGRGDDQGAGRGRSRAGSQGIGRATKKASSKKRSSEATASSTRQEDQDQDEERGRARRGYIKSPGSQYYMLFGDERRQQTQIPDLNEEYILDENVQEIPLSQNAPAIDDM